MSYTELSNIEFIKRVAEIYLIAIIALWTTSRYIIKLSVLQTFAEICICNSIVILLSPVLLLFTLGTLFIRQIINVYFKFFTKGKYLLMPPGDAVWAYEHGVNNSSIHIITICEGNCDLKKIQNIFIKTFDKLDENGTKIFQKKFYRISKFFGYYCWEDYSKEFDIKNHVKYIDGDYGETMGETDVFEFIGKLADKQLPSDKPPWEVYVVPNYVHNHPHETGKNFYTLVWRIHHSLADGISLAQGIMQFGNEREGSNNMYIDPLKPINVPIMTKILFYFKLFFVGAHFLSKLVKLDGKSCFHGEELRGSKTVGWSRPVRLEVLKKIKSGLNTTAMAILNAAAAGSLRRLALAKQLTVPGRIHAGFTVAMLPYPNIKPQNRFSLGLFPMDLSLESVPERLAFAFDAASSLKKSTDIMFSYWLMQLVGLFPYQVTKYANKHIHTTLLLSNVPGPVKTIQLFGDKLVDTIAWVPIKSGIGIVLCFWSYNGLIRCSVAYDSIISSDSLDMQIITNAFEDEIEEMAKLAGVSENDVLNTP